jgi:hypothetical protein
MVPPTARCIIYLDFQVYLFLCFPGWLRLGEALITPRQLRRAMLAMIDRAGKTAGTAYEAHPPYWAPFVVVGDGGSGR